MARPESAPVVLAAAQTDPGRKRDLNEDAVLYELTPYGGVFVVADGMGGHRTGEVASRLAVDHITANLRQDLPSPQNLVKAFEAANREIYSAGQAPESRGMGTTATALWLDLPYAILGHVGDSRAYLYRKGEMIQLTNDHSWVAERVRQGVLTEAEARNHRWRNVITNALGSFPQVRVDLIGLKVEPGDLFLLCSDGLTSVLDDPVIAEVLRNYPPEQAVPRLIALANEWGGPDNISVVVAAVGPHIPNQQRSYALAVEAARGGPVSLQLGQEPEGVTTQVIEPERPRGFWQRWSTWFLLLLWGGLLAYVLYSQFGPGKPIGP